MAPGSKKAKNQTRKKAITGKVRDELRRVIATYCYSYVFTKNGMALRDQRLLIEGMYHGDPSRGIASNKEMLYNASGRLLLVLSIF